MNLIAALHPNRRQFKIFVKQTKCLVLFLCINKHQEKLEDIYTNMSSAEPHPLTVWVREIEAVCSPKRLALKKPPPPFKKKYINIHPSIVPLTAGLLICGSLPDIPCLYIYYKNMYLILLYIYRQPGYYLKSHNGPCIPTINIQYWQ